MWLAADSGWTGLPVLALAALVTLVCAVLMCLRIAYPSFKHFAVNRRLRFTQMAAILVCFAFIALDAPRMLFTFFGMYVALGPGQLLWRAVQKNRRRRMRKAVD